MLFLTVRRQLGSSGLLPFSRDRRILGWFLVFWTAWGFDVVWSAPAPAGTNAVASASTNTAAIPLPEVADQAEATSASLQMIGAGLNPSPAILSIQEDLPVITREIDARLTENLRIISRNPSLGNLRRMESEWRTLNTEISGWNRVLTRDATQLEAESGRLDEMSQRWEHTETLSRTAKAPAEIMERIVALRASVRETQSKVEARHASVLVLQSRVSEQHSRAAQALDSIDRVRTELLEQLFLRESPPIWVASAWAPPLPELWQEVERSVTRQVTVLLSYMGRKAGRFLLHGALFLLCLGTLFWVRYRVQRHEPGASGLRHGALLIQAPISTALILSLLMSGWIYPEAPRLLWAILGALALLPASLLLRRLIDPRLIPILAALIAFYFMDQLRLVAASQPLLSRWLVLAETLGACIFLAWLLRSDRLGPVPEVDRNWLRQVIRLGARVGLGAFGVAFVANLLGYEALSDLICNAALVGADLALILYAVVRILDSLILGAFGVPPLVRLSLATRHESILRVRLHQSISAAALLVWIVCLLEATALRGLTFRGIGSLWQAKAVLGSFSFSVGDVLLFAFTIWAAFFVSRVTRFTLEEEVYPRVHLAPGLYYSISRMLHYAVLLAGFLIGLAILGVNLTKFTILAGAFGVGIGFGLQNIINNFVSGLILLFERPVKVGDLVQVENAEGVVRKIGIRASVIRTTNGSDLVVPNGNLISGAFTNWTFSRRQRLLSIPVSVAADNSPDDVIQMLKQVAAAQPSVLQEPPPRILLVGMSGGVLNFEVRAWTGRIEDWMQVKSELSLAITSALKARNIAIK